MPISYHTQVKRKARKHLHDKLSCNVFIFEASDVDFLNPIEARARLHYAFAPIGDLTGTEYSYAQWLQKKEVFAIFHLSETAMSQVPRGCILCFDKGEMYLVDSSFPKDDETFRVALKEIKLSLKPNARFPE